MPRLRLPQLARLGAKKLVGLSPESASALFNAIQAMQPTLNTSAMASRLHAAVPQRSAKEIEEIVDGLISLSYGRSLTEISLDDFVARVAEEIEVDEQLAAGARETLKTFLTAEAIVGSFKAAVVTSEAEHLFLDARIISDIRPIFGDSPTAPVGAAVVHMLKIRAHAMPDDIEFFVGLDADDIKKLQDVLTRADAKAKTLKSLVEKLGLRLFETEGQGK